MSHNSLNGRICVKCRVVIEMEAYPPYLALLDRVRLNSGRQAVADIVTDVSSATSYPSRALCAVQAWQPERSRRTTAPDAVFLCARLAVSQWERLRVGGINPCRFPRRRSADSLGATRPLGRGLVVLKSQV